MKYIPTIAMIIALVILTIITLWLNNKLSTYNSALDNTLDAKIIEVDWLKAQIKSRKDANKRDTIKVRNLICKEKNLPQKYINDWTCEL